MEQGGPKIIGGLYWIHDAHDSIIPAKFIEQGPNGVDVFECVYSNRLVFTNSCLGEVDDATIPYLHNSPDDLAIAAFASLQSVISALTRRFEQDHVYTAMGSVIVSLGLGTPRHIVTDSMISKYLDRMTSFGKLPPHVWVLAKTAHDRL